MQMRLKDHGGPTITGNEIKTVHFDNYLMDTQFDYVSNGKYIYKYICFRT